jgi:hypothetical protein
MSMRANIERNHLGWLRSLVYFTQHTERAKKITYSSP